MNKVYTIGRDTSCDIVIADPTDVVSRVHASLKVTGKGKYVLIDQSRNGTYINGIRMSSNEEIPVTRKDIISFAHVKDLDWELIPKEKDSKMMWILIAIAAAVIACVCFFILKPKEEPKPVDELEKKEQPAEKYVPKEEKKDTTAKETIYIKEKPAPAPKKGKDKGKDKSDGNKEDKTENEDTKVVDPLL